jgi:hypothetical protein
MTTDDIAAALRACANGLYPLEAGTGLRSATARSSAAATSPADSSRSAPSISDGTTAMAAIDWDAAVTALASGGLPCSGGERRMLQLSASLADGIPVDLRDAVTGLDDRNTALLVTAIQHASGKRPKATPATARHSGAP